MKSFRSCAATAAGYFPRPSTFALIAVLLLLPSVSDAQQPAAGRKKTPRLTSDDVVTPKPAQPAEGAAKEGENARPGDSAKTEATKEGAPKAQAGEAKSDPEEASWRERVEKARARAKELERQAEETELRVTQLRNDLSASGQGASNRNRTAAELDRTGQQLKDLRANARAASSDLEKLLEYGRQKGFSEAAGPKAASEDGKPNEDYYRTRYAALTEELQTTERRVQLYDNRVRDLNQRITTNSVSGDNFYIAHLKEERDESQQKLEEARAARNKAYNDIDALKEEARRAGVPPGVFRK